MLPVLASRVWYADGGVVLTEGDSPPARWEGVEFISYYHEPPYVTHAHGHWEGYQWREDPADVWLVSGPSLPDAEWETLRDRAMKAPRP